MSDHNPGDRIEAFHVHAFSQTVHGGNPAGVCVLDAWLSDGQLQRVAQDLGPSVTAFVLNSEDGTHPLRWFTRGGREVNSFCGHATFAAGHVMLRLKRSGSDRLTFLAVSGTHHIDRVGEYLTMTAPYWPVEEIACPELVIRSIGSRPAGCFRGHRDLVLLFDTVAEVMQLRPDYAAMRALGQTGVIATAQATTADIVYRFFCPGFSIAENEDHATGSALSSLAPYWTGRLGTTKFSAFQGSTRGGHFLCEVNKGVVTVVSHCATFLVGTIHARPEIEGSPC
jgi:predicted PhzF superfamily epimerase YddE/YHI9